MSLRDTVMGFGAAEWQLDERNEGKTRVECESNALLLSPSLSETRRDETRSLASPLLPSLVDALFLFFPSRSLSLSPPLSTSLSFFLFPSPPKQQHHQAWLDGRHAVVGTKCNQLLLLDVDARSGTRVALPPAHARQPRPAGMDSPGHGVFNASGPKGSGMHTTAVSPDGRLLASGGSDATDAQIFRIERG